MKIDIEKFLDADPEDYVQLVKLVIAQYKPAAYSILKELFALYEDYANNTDIPVAEAKAKRNRFDAYVGVGFSEDQAMALILNDNLQLKKNIKKSVSNMKREKDGD